MNQLIDINRKEDIPSKYLNTPIGLLLEYHNLSRPFDSFKEALQSDTPVDIEFVEKKSVKNSKLFDPFCCCINREAHVSFFVHPLFFISNIFKFSMKNIF